MKTEFAKISFIKHADFFSLLAGVIATASMPPYSGTGWLIVIAMTLFMVSLIRGANPVRQSFWFSVGHQATLLHWLFFIIPEASITYRWMVPLAGSLVVAYVSLYYLFFGFMFRLIQRHINKTIAVLSAPMLWVFIEFLRSTGELGFPWCLVGASSLSFSPMLKIVSIIGELGLSFIIMLISVSFAFVFNKQKILALTTGIMSVLLVVLALIMVDTKSGVDCKNIRIAVVQANVSLKDKWDSEKKDASLIPYQELTVEAVTDSVKLVVWAETAIPAYLRYDREIFKWVKGVADSNNVFLYTGYPDATRNIDGSLDRFNGSGLFSPEGKIINRYAKHHLLPFGERMPFQSLFPWLGSLDFGQAEWTPGAEPAGMKIPDSDGAVISGLICYESIFSTLIEEAVSSGTNIIVNITNDGWFGKRAGPLQHAQLARLRAAEYGIPVVRCANNGVSFVCDRRGNIEKILPLYEKGFITADVNISNERSYFSRHGYSTLWVVLAIWVVVVGVVWTRERNNV